MTDVFRGRSDADRYDDDVDGNVEAAMFQGGRATWCIVGGWQVQMGGVGDVTMADD